MSGNNREMPTVFVIFGVTGDLMARKIAPALYSLYKKGALPERFRVVGFARRSFHERAFRAYVGDLVRAYPGLVSDERHLGAFLSRFFYVQSLFDDPRGYERLDDRLRTIDEEWATCANKLFYLAIPPALYELVFSQLALSGLGRSATQKKSETRILVEKPFGEDAATAERLDRALSSLFEEEQIYRIDHYLAKEMVQNILTFRFANNLLEPNWSNEAIARIDIRLLEKAGVEHRGAFYDAVGAFRDVGQNHLLQVLALLTMEHPGGFGDEAIRSRRAEVLSKLHLFSPDAVGRETFRAQYSGYRAIKEVRPRTDTETYFMVRAFVDSPRWRGVPICLEGGKRMKEQVKEAVITFRHPSPCLCPPETKTHYTNKIIITFEPQEGIRIDFWSKQPGFEMQLEPRTFDFALRAQGTKIQYIEEYEKLLLDCVHGDQTLFVRTDEVRAMWRFTDPVLDAWRKGAPPLRTYAPDTEEARREAASALEAPKRARPVLRREIGVVGLGKMGGNVARQLHEKGWRVFAYNRTRETARALQAEGAVMAVDSLGALVTRLRKPRVIWLMLTAGEAVDEALRNLVPHLQKGDIVIEAGNSFFKDSVRRAKRCARRGVRFVDAGVSGGPRGARYGASIMVGGQREDFELLEPLFRDLAILNGYQFFEGYGAGHFVKMVHNGIEYGMMQAIAEGFAVLEKSSYKLDLTRVADIYNHGSVIESRLIGWLEEAFALFSPALSGVSGKVAHTGEGAWTVLTAKELGVAAKIIEGALRFRIQSARTPSYTGKIVSALRGRFGGHKVAER